MTKKEVMSKLNEIFIDIFADDDIVLTDETTAEDVEGWDSLEQINIILACERTWGVKFDLEELSHMKNVGEMAALIASKVA